MLYELIQPSDPITFEANCDKIAYFCALILGSGQAGIKRQDGEPCQSPLLMFHPEPMPLIESFLGCSLAEFCDQNALEIAACFNSFAYGSFEERQTFADAISAIDNPEKLRVFKEKHEDRNRTSMSPWVKNAWAYGERFASQNILNN